MNKDEKRRALAEYKRRHDEIWPEMKAMFEEAGMHNYSVSAHCRNCPGAF